MPSSSVLEKLRAKLGSLEETHRRFARTVPIADAVDRWLPHGGLPAGCIHEVKGSRLANALAFSAILAARLAGEDGKIVCIMPDRALHPLGLLPYGVRLNQVLFVATRHSQDLAWALMEALRCPQVSAVLTVLSGADLTTCRRLQLAAEGSHATGFLMGESTSAPNASPITRWKISSSPATQEQPFDEPVWTLDLLYCRGGRPGNWAIEWRNRQLKVAE